MTPLRTARLQAGYTQRALALVAAVGQGALHRWESGAEPIPPAALDRLALALDISATVLQGEAAPMALHVARGSEAESTYFGEVTLHFTHGQPLLVPISHATRERMRQEAERGHAWSVFDSLDNRVIVLRLTSLSDLFFSSEQGEDSGPEAGRYEPGPGVFPEDAFWETVEKLYAGDLPELDRLNEAQRAVAEVLWPGAASEDARYSDQHTQSFFANATETVWQCASGFRRSAWMHDDAALLPVVESLAGWDDTMVGLVRLPVDEHQVVQVNPQEIDYLSVPGHRLRRVLA